MSDRLLRGIFSREKFLILLISPSACQKLLPGQFLGGLKVC